MNELNHQDILCITCIDDKIICGSGSSILTYKNNSLWNKLQVFDGQNVHSIVGKAGESNLIILGGKHIARCRFDATSHISVDDLIVVEDWILDAKILSASELILVTAHNQAQTWVADSEHKLSVQSKSSCEERCILYSGKIHETEDRKLIILAGTVYSEVIIWIPDFTSDGNGICSVLQRLVGHKGVIFSISVKEVNEDQHLICTTSDDRSVRLWSTNAQWTPNSEPKVMFGHAARVWKSLLTDNFIVTIGEDSLLCVWTYEGELVNRITVHQGGGIRGLAYHENGFVLTGGRDGGLVLWNLETMCGVNKKVESNIPLTLGEIPRKVRFQTQGHVLASTYSGRIVSSNIYNSVVAESKELCQCTDLDMSPCKRYVAACTVGGSVFIFDTTMENTIVGSTSIKSSCCCQSLRWRGSHLVLNLKGGSTVLFQINDDHSFKEIGSYSIPKSRDNAATCFLLVEDESKLLLGDRLGHLHLFNVYNCAEKCGLRKLHSCLGMNDIFNWKDRRTILTAGAGGWIREIICEKDEMIVLRSYSTVLESPSRIIKGTHGILILGFLGTDFKVWDFEQRYILASYNCGGGHRSWDCQIDDENCIDFVFIKDKAVHTTSLKLNRGTVLHNGFHAKSIYCLNVISNNTFVSGGEDNTVRIASFSEKDLKTKFIFEQHISNVKAIGVCKITESELLIFSAGGREQLSIYKFDTQNEDCRLLLTHFSESSRVESRYMCLETYKMADTILIATGTSGCSIEIFSYRNNILRDVAALQTARCVIQITFMQVHSETFICAFNTEGTALLWNIRGATDGDVVIHTAKTFQLHSSGINSCQVRCFEDKGNVLLATGGDDNVVGLTLFKCWRESNHELKWKDVSQWRSDSAHGAQITGLVMQNNILLSTGIDQRIAIHTFEIDDECLSVRYITFVMSSISDIHGMTPLFQDGAFHVCVFGKGIEVVAIDCDKIECDTQKQKDTADVICLR